MWRMLYIITLVIILSVYAFSCFYFVKFKSNKLLDKPWLINLIFAVTIFTCHAIHLLIIYLDVGFNDWNFQNAMPYANVSPLMFTVAPLFLLLPQNIKKYCLNLVSILTIGMILSPTISIVHNIIINYKFHASFFLDYVPHLLFAIWGIYIIHSGQIELKIKSSIISGSIIIGVAICMLIINVIFDQSFFGLSLNGKHNIYNQQIVSNSYLSAFIYFSGLILILVLGFLFQSLLNYIKKIV